MQVKQGYLKSSQTAGAELLQQACNPVIKLHSSTHTADRKHPARCFLVLATLYVSKPVLINDVISVGIVGKGENGILYSVKIVKFRPDNS